MYDRNYTWRERLFYALAWTPKATVQASLSAVPLSLIQSTMAGRPDADTWRVWGEEILTTGVFAIIICEATFGGAVGLQGTPLGALLGAAGSRKAWAPAARLVVYQPSCTPADHRRSPSSPPPQAAPWARCWCT
jgi:hypothetical protein